MSEEADEGFAVETEGPAEITETPYEPDIGDVIQYRTVEVVDSDRAAELAAEGERIWGSNNTD